MISFKEWQCRRLLGQTNKEISDEIAKSYPKSEHDYDLLLLFRHEIRPQVDKSQSVQGQNRNDNI